jgi:hypothetical protein
VAKTEDFIYFDTRTIAIRQFGKCKKVAEGNFACLMIPKTERKKIEMKKKLNAREIYTKRFSFYPQYGAISIK